MQFTRAGDRGLMIELGEVSFDELHAAAAAARAIEGVSACVVGHSSLLLLDVTVDAARAALDSLEVVARASIKTHRLEVGFTDAASPDLPLLLARTGMTLERFLVEVAAIRLRARFLGFLAGFAYLEGIPGTWALPRRATSRVRVPAGSFAIGGEMAAFYPVDSPGGWNLIGCTSAPLWDEEREPPNLIAAGDEIEIVPVTMEGVSASRRHLAERLAPRASPPIAARRDALRHVGETPTPRGGAVATVIGAGQRTLLVGRRDVRRYDFGLSPGGPFDPDAAAAANRAVGNPESAMVLECAFVGPELRFHEDRRLAWYGADASVARQFVASRNSVVRLGPLRNGARGYLAVEGGWTGTVARYALAPEAISPDTPLQATSACATRARISSLAREPIETLRALLGPHPISSQQQRLLETSEWEVTPASDRVGVRFRATSAVSIETPAMMRSCGVQFGTVQWHPDGALVAMGPDHPVTGGYLQPMTILSSELWKLAQLSPGMRVRFVCDLSSRA